MTDKEELFGFDPEFLKKNGDTFFNLGLSALKKENYIEAAALFDTSYQIAPTFEKSQLLAKCLLETNETKKAYEVVFDFLEEYQEKFEDALFVISLMEDMNQFIELHQFYVAIEKKLPHHQQEIVERERVSNLLENKYTRSKQAEFGILGGIIERAHNSDFEVQLGIYIGMKNMLPLDQFIRYTKDWLADPKLDWVVRVSILEDYARLELNLPFPYLAYPNQLVQVVPAEIPKTAFDVPVYYKIMEELEGLENNAPDQYELVKEEVKIELSCLYPLAEEFFQEDEIESYVDFLIFACKNGSSDPRFRNYPPQFTELFKYTTEFDE